jgi:cobalamin biosynthesis protein CobC
VEQVIRHGGDLDEARRLFPEAPEPWIDLSTGINPVPYAIPPLASALFQRLPSPAEATALEEAAARAYGVGDPSEVAAAPGTQALIELLPRLLVAEGRVVVLGPTYAEHARAWRKSGRAVEEVEGDRLLDLVGDPGVGFVVVVNPNNPDGRVLPLNALSEAAAALHCRGGWLVVDEAFIDLEAAESLAPRRPPGTVILRSFGKTFGLAGLRLGFAVAAAPVASSTRSSLGSWAVSGPAIAIGRQALLDRSWLATAAAERARDACRLDALLGRVGAVVGGTCLFRLLETPNAPDLFDRLGRHGVFVRRFDAAPHRLRFGLPGSDEAWARLEAALGA